MSNQSYNGWANYETWCVNLWLTNEPQCHERLMAIVQNCDTLGDQAEAIRQWVRPELGREEPYADSIAGMYVDLLASALDVVQWREIVRTNTEGVGDEVGRGGGVGDVDSHRD